MRELSLPEIRLVAGGNGWDGPSLEDTRRLGTVVVVGQRTGSTDWSAFANGTHGFSPLTPVNVDYRPDEGGEASDEPSFCDRQVVVTGVTGDVSYRGVTISAAIGTETVNGDGDVWLMLNAGAGVDLRQLAGSDLVNLFRQALAPSPGASAFASTMANDDCHGDIQYGVSAAVFGMALSADGSGIGGGGQFGSSQFSVSVTGGISLNLTDLAAQLGTSVQQMLANWNIAMSALDNQTRTGESAVNWFLANTAPLTPGTPTIDDFDEYDPRDSAFGQRR